MENEIFKQIAMLLAPTLKKLHEDGKNGLYTISTQGGTITIVLSTNEDRTEIGLPLEL